MHEGQIQILVFSGKNRWYESRNQKKIVSSSIKDSAYMLPENFLA